MFIEPSPASWPIALAVNGYGAPADPLTDPGLTGYLSAVLNYCHSFPHIQFQLHLLGGCTNRADMSEAAAMWEWLTRRPWPDNLDERVVMHKSPLDLRSDLESLREDLNMRGYPPQQPVVYFCEASRRPAVEYLAVRMFRSRIRVIGLNFDKQAMSLSHRIYQAGPKLWIEILAYELGGPIEWLRRRLRQRHIDKHHRLAS